MNCPKCGSENTQTIKMAIMTGSSTGNTLGVGVAMHGGLGIGVGAGTTHTKSDLTKSLEVGTKPVVLPDSLSSFFAGSLAFSTLMMGLWARGAGNTITSVVLFIATVFFGFCSWAVWSTAGTIVNKELEEWETKNNLKENGWLCLRCGEKWLPGKEVGAALESDRTIRGQADY